MAGGTKPLAPVYETLFAATPPHFSPGRPRQSTLHCGATPLRPALFPQKQKLPDCVPAKMKLRLPQVALHPSFVMRIDQLTKPLRSLEPGSCGSGESRWPPLSTKGRGPPLSTKQAKAPFGRVGGGI